MGLWPMRVMCGPAVVLEDQLRRTARRVYNREPELGSRYGAAISAAQPIAGSLFEGILAIAIENGRCRAYFG